MKAGAVANGEVQKTLRHRSCSIFRVGDGSVFTEDAGFKLLLGQTEEFPLLQVSLLFCVVNIDKLHV